MQYNFLLDLLPSYSKLKQHCYYTYNTLALSTDFIIEMPITGNNQGERQPQVPLLLIPFTLGVIPNTRSLDLAQRVRYNATYSMNEIDVAIETHRQILQLLSDEDEEIDKMTARADFSFALKARLRHRDIELPSGVQRSAEDLRDADEMAKKESSLALMISNTITVSETNFINQTCL